MNKYISRITSSARGEAFNPLAWVFLFTTLCYGLAFAIGYPLGLDIGVSPLYDSMTSIISWAPGVWGVLATLNIVLGATFLLFNIPPFGRVSGLFGFMLWVFASFCYGLAGDYLVLFAVGFPQMFFWIWQYMSLSLFRLEDAEDKDTMAAYDAGDYDDELNPKDAKVDREDNRGVAEQQ